MVGKGRLSEHRNTFGVGLDEINEAGRKSKGITEQDWFRCLVPNECVGGQADPSAQNENSNRKGGKGSASDHCTRGCAGVDVTRCAWKLEARN